MGQDDTTRGRAANKRPAGHVEQPVEYAFMSTDDWLDFHCELHDVVQELGIRVERIEPGVLRLKTGASLPLLALVEQCNVRPRDDWPGLMDRYLDRIADLLGPIPSGAPSTIELRVRLIPSTPIDEGMLAGLGAQPVADGIAAVLSVDSRQGPRTVAPDEIERLGWDLDTAWDAAWSQTSMLVEPDEIDVVDIGGVDVIHVFGRSEYTASLVPHLDLVLGPMDDAGALIGLPCDHTVLVHPIEGTSSRRAIGTMVPIIRRLHGDGPGSLSPQLYWWRGGELTWIPTVFGGPTNEVYLPYGLGDILAA